MRASTSLIRLPFIRHQAYSVRYWNRLTQMPDSRLTKRIFLWDHDIAIRGRRCWNKDIQAILVRSNISELFLQENWGTRAIPATVKTVTDRLTQQDREQRRVAAQTMSRLRLYNAVVVPSTAAAPYVQTPLTRSQRSLIAKLRSGTLPLAIETGRYTQVPPNERLCHSCNNGVEDELHFLFICDRYGDLRQTHILCNETRYMEHVDILKYMFDDTRRTKRLARYLALAMDLRIP